MRYHGPMGAAFTARKMVAVAVLALCATSCSGNGAGSGAAAASRTTPEGPLTTPQGDLVGDLDRLAIERAVPAWAEARVASNPDDEASRGLAAVSPGARVDVFLGTWCGDSRREIARLWAAFDEAGVLPFEVRYVGVDRTKVAPDGLSEGRDIEYVPTIIVYRADAEVGRIVESAPEGVEVALLALLRGERTGVITGRDDL